MKVAVCDDDGLIREQLTAMVNRLTGEESCVAFEDGDQLVTAMKELEHYDVILMDIEWAGEERGIRFSSQMKEISPDTCIIYVTGYTLKYVQQVFLHQANVTGFLMKPVDEELLRRNLEKCEESCRERDRKQFFFKYKKKLHSVYFDDIQYIESFGHRLCIVTEKEEYSCYGKLGKLLETFPEQFLYCHKSFLVNRKAIRQLREDHMFELKNGSTVPISKKNYASVREAYFQYIMSEAFDREVGV